MLNQSLHQNSSIRNGGLTPLKAKLHSLAAEKPNNVPPVFQQFFSELDQLNSLGRALKDGPTNDAQSLFSLYRAAVRASVDLHELLDTFGFESSLEELCGGEK